VGTDAWRNWRAFTDHADELENFDDELHSDVPFVGNGVRFGPFALMPVIRRSVLAGPVAPSLILHGGVHANLIPEIIKDGQLASTNSDSYHGGSMSDEIAALISLILGVRLRVAGTRRLSGIHDLDHPSDPINLEVPRLSRPGRPDWELLPGVVKRLGRLDKLGRLETFPVLEESLQTGLIRSARAYSAALWWCNENADYAWLQWGLFTRPACRSAAL
jgi:hypothetical protein